MPSSNLSSSFITYVVSDLPRLHTNSGGYVYITCNDAGVEFVRYVSITCNSSGYVGYSTAANLTVWNALYVPECVKDLFSSDRTVSYTGHYNLILAIQVTELNDHVFDGYTVNHAVMDGTSLRLPEFSRSSVLISPAVIRFPEGGPKVTFKVDNPLQERIFSFSKEAIQKLPARTNSNNKNKKWIETANGADVNAVEILGKQSKDPYQKKGRVTAIIENRLKVAVSKPPQITSSTDDDVRKRKRTTQLPCSKTITMSILLCIVSLVALITPLAEARSTLGHFPRGSSQGAHSTFTGSRKVSRPRGDDMVRVSVKGAKTGWMPLSRSWGVNRQMNSVLVGQSLSFRVTGGDGRTSTFHNIVPSTWQLDQTTDGKNTKQVPYRKLLSSFHSPPAGIKHTRPIHAFKLYWRSGPGFGIQSLPSEVQGPESAAPVPAPARY